MKACRECKHQVSEQATACPQCGAPGPSALPGGGWGFEWKSRRKIFGIPLVHVAIGMKRNHRPRVAKGIIAIGQFAIGLIAVAQFGVGILFGLGQFVTGIIAVGQLAGGVLFGIGQFSCGLFAIGQVVVAHCEVLDPIGELLVCRALFAPAPKLVGHGASFCCLSAARANARCFTIAAWAFSRTALILMKPNASCWSKPPSMSMLARSWS